jgi:hypothetical protein
MALQICPLLGYRFVTHNNGVTGKCCSLCGPCQGYITSGSCDNDSLETAVRGAGVVVRQAPVSKDVNIEAEEVMALEFTLAKPYPACCVFTSCSLATALNNGEYSASVVTPLPTG